MFVRITTVRKGDKVYQYPQIVESVRGANGKPTHRVIASLKGATPEQVENIRLALQAAKKGEKLVIQQPLTQRPDIVANRDYLDVAVIDAIWREWSLGTEIDALADGGFEVAIGQVVQALVTHRCVAPSSKLAAAKWFRRTALPEMMGVSPSQFNNSRLHRALDALRAIEAPLRGALRRRIMANHGVWSCVFLDLSDTWFVGRGPNMARSGKTKEGLYRRKVGIALICDQRGFPLDWRTVEGGVAEAPVMLDMLRDATTPDADSTDPWVEETPVVLDRAMGRFEYVTTLIDMNVRFITALVRSEIPSYTADVPCEALAAVKTAGTPDMRERDQERLASAAEAAGMKPTSNGLYVRDLGIVSRERDEGYRADAGANAALMEQLLDFQVMKEQGIPYDTIAKRHGVSPRALLRLKKILGLHSVLQQRVLAGEAEPLVIAELQRIGSLPVDAQDEAFEQALRQAAETTAVRRRPSKLVHRRRRRVLVRLVACFRPSLCLDKRASAERRDQELHALVQHINISLARRGSRLRADRESARVVEWLRRESWLSIYDVGTVTTRRGHDFQQLTLTRNEDEWNRRRQWDGFVVLAAHSQVIGKPETLAEMYWSREIVERGFRTIKSEVELRPVYHQTDPKVTAHVTVCVLALLILRVIEQRLREAGTPATASAVLETLATCRLNELDTKGNTKAYVITRPTPEQMAWLKALDLEHLAEDGAFANPS